MYISIGRLEIYYNSGWTFGRFRGSCGCRMLELGPLGFTWLDKKCKEMGDQ